MTDYPEYGIRRSVLVDSALALHTVIFLCLYVTDAVLALRPFAPFLSWPVEMFVLMLAPILLRVHLPDYKSRHLRLSFKLWRDHAVVLLPFLLLALWNALMGIQELYVTFYTQGQAIYILFYRFVMLLGGMSVAVFIFQLGWRQVLTLVFVVLVGSIFYDVANPGVLGQVVSRAGGFQQNPNLAAISTVLLLALIVRYDRFHLFDLMIILVAFIAVFATLSRGGILQFAVFAVSYVGLTGRGQRLKQLVLLPLIGFAFIYLGAATIATLTTSSAMFDAENAQRRMATLAFQNDATYGTDDVRLDLVPRYLNLIDSAALFGYGPGVTRTMDFGPHNTYLLIWFENGLVGLTLFLCFIFGMLKTFWKRRFWPGFVFTQVVAVAAFFTHNAIQLPVIMISGGVALGLSWMIYRTSAADGPVVTEDGDLFTNRSAQAVRCG